MPGALLGPGGPGRWGATELVCHTTTKQDFRSRTEPFSWEDGWADGVVGRHLTRVCACLVT